MTPSEIMPVSKKIEWNEGRLLTWVILPEKRRLWFRGLELPFLLLAQGLQAVSSLVSEGRAPEPSVESCRGGTAHKALRVTLPPQWPRRAVHQT